MASGPLTMISVRLGSRRRSLIGLSSVDMSGMSAADGWEGARIMGQVLRKPQQLVSAKWTARDRCSANPVIRLPAALGLANSAVNEIELRGSVFNRRRPRI